MSRHFYFVPVGSSCLAYIHRVELSRHLLPWNIFWTNSFICFIVHYIFFLLEKNDNNGVWLLLVFLLLLLFLSLLILRKKNTRTMKKNKVVICFYSNQIRCYNLSLYACVCVCVLIGVNARANILWMNSQHFVYIDQKKRDKIYLPLHTFNVGYEFGIQFTSPITYYCHQNEQPFRTKQWLIYRLNGNIQWKGVKIRYWFLFLHSI